MIHKEGYGGAWDAVYALTKVAVTGPTMALIGPEVAITGPAAAVTGPVNAIVHSATACTLTVPVPSLVKGGGRH